MRGDTDASPWEPEAIAVRLRHELSPPALRRLESIVNADGSTVERWLWVQLGRPL